MLQNPCKTLGFKKNMVTISSQWPNRPSLHPPYLQNDGIPVSLDAALTLILCYKVKSTGHIKNERQVRSSE